MSNKILIHIEGKTDDGSILFHRKVDFRAVMRGIAEMLPYSDVERLALPEGKRKRGRPRKSDAQ